MEQERQGEERGEGLKRALELLSKNSETRRPYAWVVKKEFARISKILKEGWTFEAIYEHLATFKFLPENGDAGNLRRAYRREEKRRAAEGGITEQKEQHDTKKTAISPTTPPPPPVLKPPVQPTQPPPPPPIMGRQVVNRENETDEERRRRIRRELGTVINTGTSRIIKHSDGTFDVLDDDGNIQDYYVAPKKFS